MLKMHIHLGITVVKVTGRGKMNELDKKLSSKLASQTSIRLQLTLYTLCTRRKFSTNRFCTKCAE